MSNAWKLSVVALISLIVWGIAGWLRPAPVKAEIPALPDSVSPSRIRDMTGDAFDEWRPVDRVRDSAGKNMREMRRRGILTDRWFNVRPAQLKTGAMVLIFSAIAMLVIGLLFLSYESGSFKLAPTGGWIMLLSLVGIGLAQSAVIAHAVAPGWADHWLPVKSPEDMRTLTMLMSAVGIIVSNYIMMKSNSVRGPGAFWYRLGAPLGLANLVLAILIGWWVYRGGSLPVRII